MLPAVCASRAMIRVEVAYALADRQWLLTIEVPTETTVRQAIRLSGLPEQIPGLDFEAMPVGIFSRRCSLDTVVRDGDRIELYRPLQVDPKEARRRRAGIRGSG